MKDFDWQHKNSNYNKSILILGPHEDDEALMCAGVIERALKAGCNVRVGIITNGDTIGMETGLIRIMESVNALEYLGLDRNNIIFFGYGNTGGDKNGFLYRLYNALSDTEVIPSNVGIETYGMDGFPEYHFKKFGVHGKYNRVTFRQDLEWAISECDPDDIYITSRYDMHTDHAVLYDFVVEAIRGVRDRRPDFSPLLHEYLVHSPDGEANWPVQDNGEGALASFSKPVTFDASPMPHWSKREVVPVPSDMQVTSKSDNKKYNMIKTYESQQLEYLFPFVKSDEFFWIRDFSDIAIKEFKQDNLNVKVFNSREAMGKAAADEVSVKIRQLLAKKAEVNMIFAAAPSQNEFLDALSKDEDICWQRINAFHMDEYMGLVADAPQRFGSFLKNRLFGRVPLKSVNYINGSAGNIEDECSRYGKLLEEYPPDIVCLGIGENGHIAFNDPHSAMFNDSVPVKPVTLDDACRMQQVNDRCFDSFGEVPDCALTLTIPSLNKAEYLFCMVPGRLKAQAVLNTVKGDISEACPATILRTHKNAVLYCDPESAGEIF